MSGPQRDVGTLAIRLAAALALAAAGLFGVLAFAITRFSWISGEPGAGYRLPGTHAVLDPMIVTVLGTCATAAAALGLGVLALSPMRLPRARLPVLHRRARRSIIVLVFGLLALTDALVIKGAIR